MKSKTIDGYDLRNWFQSGHREVDLNKSHINSINVFPVADGDTGTNLSMTLRAMAEWPATTRSFGSMIERISESGMAHARGNSGLIFASYVNGIAAEGKSYETVTLSEFSQVAHRAVDYLYKAIEEPVEGTMISVIRDWASFLSNRHSEFEYFDDLFAEAYQTAQISLAHTPDQLEILKRNHVVDSGAEGFVRFLKGINRLFSQEDVPVLEEIPEMEIFLISEDAPSDYRYCSEFYFHHSGVDPEVIRHDLENLGDSLIISSHHDNARVHLHTNHPEKVLPLILKHGEILEQKVDDMMLQNQVLHHRKSPVALLTDSIADFPDELKLNHQVHSVPLTVLMDDVPYLDKRTVGLKELFESIPHLKSYPTSSQPEPGRVRDMFDYLHENYDSIIVISVSEKLSGTFGVFSREADRLEKLGKKVTVINSRLNSGAQGLLVKKAAELLDSGFSHEETVHEILALIPKTKIYVCLDTIENAVRGGRVPNTIGQLGIRLGARPIMTLDPQGNGAAFGVAFSKAGITKKIFALIRTIKESKGIQSYSIVHADNPLLAGIYEDRLTELAGKKPEFVTEISAVTAIHSGPGCVAISLIEEQ